MAAAVALSFTACSGKKDTSSGTSSQPGTAEATTGTELIADELQEEITTAEEGAPAHISPMEKVTANLGFQVDPDTVIERENGKNTFKMPISDFVREGDRIKSFTFVIYGEDGNINEFKGGFGISVLDGCPAATDKEWAQTKDHTFPTEGRYGEITWEVPDEIADYVNVNGEVLFGYWWGDATKIRIGSIICQYTRTINVPVDGTAIQSVGQTVDFNNNDEMYYKVPLDFLPEDMVPESVTVDLSAGGDIGKYQGNFELDSPLGNYSSEGFSVITKDSSLQLTWFLTEEAKKYYAANSTFKLGYWFGDRTDVTMNFVTVRYSHKDTQSRQEQIGDDGIIVDIGFRNANEIVEAMNVGWNLGNSLDSYKTGLSGTATETGWGNPATTPDMVKSVKSAGFNTIRIPVTWGEHLDGTIIDPSWLARVQEVVDYAYNEGLFVILDMHHDDYIWLTPDNEVYIENSAKLRAIWLQIANRFKDYGDRLIFEGLNEPRTIGSVTEWRGGTTEERAVVNNYEADFVKTIRSSGGNNPARTLIITSYAASAESVALNDVIVPKTGNIIVSVHYYAPWKFSEGNADKFDDEGRAEIDAKFIELRSKFIDRGIPVIIDEFGCVAKADNAERAKYYKYYIASAKSQGIKCVVWDNGITTGDGGFGIFTRSSNEWNKAILKAIMDGAAS